MKKINGVLFDSLEEFNSFLSKATNKQIQMEVDWIIMNGYGIKLGMK